MTPEQFIAKWQANRRGERQSAQEHFIDLCRLLDEPTPNTDPDGSTYAFEKGATKVLGGQGWADVWRKNCFAWEYKGKHKDLDGAYRQLLQYAGPLGNPPLLVVSDIERIVVRTAWTNAISERHDVLLPELADPAKRHLLKAVLSEPDRLRPAKTREALTGQAATEFAALATQLRARGHDPQAVAHFVNRLVFCLFADDVGLLPAGLFDQMLSVARREPAEFADFARTLFGAMARRGGRVGFQAVPWFNGGLFDDDAALPLEAADLAVLERVAALDWAEIDPSILGTLFERGLDPDKRSQLGAHYTDREKIEKLIDPVIRRPLAAEWAETRAKIEAVLARRAARTGRAATRDTPADARKLLDGYLERLRNFRVLDPACGSGNFLYLSLLALKDLEHQASLEAETLGLQRGFPRVGPECVLGIEINPYAAELARVSVWIGHIQWARRHGLPPPSDPVLRPLDTIECRDAVLGPDGKPAAWPRADAIVGNPPILGTKKQLGTLGENYTGSLRAAYARSVPASSDLCCYWLERARQEMIVGPTERVGLVATSNVRAGYSRWVLDKITEKFEIYEAWNNEPWTLEGAALRVALVCFGKTRKPTTPMLNDKVVTRINSDLSSSAADITSAARLSSNSNVAFSGTVKGGKLDIAGDLARRWLPEPANPNGRLNAEVLMPWVNTSDVTGRPRGMWIIDFGVFTEPQAELYISPFAHLLEHVKPIKQQSTKYGKKWWLLSEPCPGMRRAISKKGRFIATPTGASHRVFVWLDARIQADHQLVIIAKEDDACFGILHSRFHEVWTRRLCTYLGVGDDPRYNPKTTFETFPFPEKLTPNLPAASYADDPRAQAIAAAARELVARRDAWLNPPELVDIVPEVVAGYPDRIIPKDARAAAILKGRTLTNLYNTRGTPAGAWLDNLHRALDEAVAAAYGWPADLPDDEVLARLLALNHERAGGG